MPSNDEKKPAQDAEKKATATNLTKTNATGNTGKQDKTGKTVAFAKPKRKLSIGWWFGHHRPDLDFHILCLSPHD
jgi:hypothetical protein